MTMATANPSPQRHERFWFPDGNVILLVQNTLYHVHRFFFEIYATNFSLIELEFEGTGTSTTPYVVDADVTTLDFDRLLACFYPRALWVEEIQTCEEWTSVLKLATKWGFESLRTRALSIVETAGSPVDKVVLGRQYDLPDLLLPGYVALCQSTVPLSYEDALRLGMQDVVDIYHIRHQLYGSNIAPVSYEDALTKVKAYASAEDSPDSPKDTDAAQHNVDNACELMVAGPMLGSGAQPVDKESDVGQVSLVSGGDSSSSGALPDAPQHGLDAQVATPDTEGELVNANISTNDGEAYAETVQLGHDPEHDGDESVAGAPTDADAEFDVLSESRTTDDEFDEEQAPMTSDNSSSSRALAGTPPYDADELLFQPEAVGPYIVEQDYALPGPSGTTFAIPHYANQGQGFQYLNAIMENFDSASDQVILWLNTQDCQTLRQFTQLMVKRVGQEHGIPGAAIRLCIKIAMNISGQIQDATRLKGKKKNPMKGKPLFREYLGEACVEVIKSASAKCRSPAATNQQAELRRLHLIEFLGVLSNKPVALLKGKFIRNIIDIFLADKHDEEATITLCMILPKIGQHWETSNKSTRKQLEKYFQQIATLSQTHRSPRARAALLDIIKLRQRGWTTTL